MTPLFSCSVCKHPAILAAKQCKKAMELSNAQQHQAAEALLRQAMRGLLRAPLPLMRAKLLNSLGLIYAQQNQPRRAERCFSASLTLIDRHVGRDNWLYSRISNNAANLTH